MIEDSPQIATILEVRRKPNGEMPESLISAAYYASRETPVMLVLDAVSPKDVDLVLDPVVSKVGYGLRGVIYANANDAAVITMAAAAGRVFAASESFRAKLAAFGIPFDDVAHAEPALRQSGA